MSETMRLFLCGDVMTGRGIDQILPHPSQPQLYERHVKDARGYVRLADRAHGRIPRPVDYGYIWGDAREALHSFQPAANIINLETAVTRSDDHWPGKGIHYRMHPDNLPCLTQAGVDVCSLANNHVLDWGYGGLEETQTVLEESGIRVAGAGRDLDQAQRPAALKITDGQRLSVFGLGLPTSGVSQDWAAAETRAGVHLLPDYSPDSVQGLLSLIQRQAAEGDLVVVSIHWGGNWGFHIPGKQRRLAHRLIEEAGVDVVHGHSSHHVKGIEVHRERLILYGCGDFINDYEGIKGRERFRGDLTLMYFPALDPESGRLIKLSMVPLKRRNLQLQKAGEGDARWLLDLLNREGAERRTRFSINEDMLIELSGTT